MSTQAQHTNSGDAKEFPVTMRGTARPVRMWAHEHEVEQEALAQLRRIADLPWVHGVRVMPDVHLGKGATVGSVIAMKDAVSPSAVGVDIGCGVSAVRTSLTVDDLPDSLASLRSGIEATIPVGHHGHKGHADLTGLPWLKAEFSRQMAGFDDLRAPRIAQRREKAASQCGSLGSGNHFAEVCRDHEGRIWLTLHSGSRNIGKELAERHINAAKGLEHNLGLPDRDLAVFLGGTPEMDAYLHDLHWAQDYAALNRRIQMALIQRVVGRHFPGVEFVDEINVHHNYAITETLSDGTELVVTRKGAIRAGKGDMALIPGSMGTGSYVVRGLGNEESYWSASHGAGRRMSRTRARKEFTADDLAAQTAGIECRKDLGVVDEIPAAYKSIDSVIEAQSDLVEVVARLHTLLCVKG